MLLFDVTDSRRMFSISTHTCRLSLSPHNIRPIYNTAAPEPITVSVATRTWFYFSDQYLRLLIGDLGIKIILVSLDDKT